jgi:hypothetical protein
MPMSPPIAIDDGTEALHIARQKPRQRRLAGVVSSHCRLRGTTMAHFPKSKTDGCVSIEAGNVFVIQDLHGRELARLDRVTALVWRLADGATPVQDIVRALRSGFDIAGDEELVWSALDRLADLDLLTERFTPPASGAQSSRRGVIRMATLGAAAAAATSALGIDQAHAGPVSTTLRPVPTTAPKPTTTARPTTTTARPTTTTTRSPTTRAPRPSTTAKPVTTTPDAGC